MNRVQAASAMAAAQGTGMRGNRGCRVALLTVRGVVTDVVATVAPEELAVWAGLEPMDDARLDQALSRRMRRREPLGFGLETVVVLITPVLWATLSEVAKRAAQTAGEGAATRVTRRLRRWTGRRGAAEPLVLPPLDAAQIRQVHRMVLERCNAAGIKDVRAAAVADGVAARLLHAASDEGTAPDTSCP